MDISQSDLREMLNAEDIEGLLALGAPNDEYASEARSIASAVSELDETHFAEEAVTEVVRGVWIRAFGPFSRADIERRSRAFGQVARDIQARAVSSADSASTHPSR